MNDLAVKLQELANHMREVAVEMDYYGGFGRIAIHKNELLGAAEICDNWATELKQETGETGNALDTVPGRARID